jgi:hypothetical protein
VCWARQDSNLGPTDYEKAYAVSARLGMSGICRGTASPASLPSRPVSACLTATLLPPSAVSSSRKVGLRLRSGQVEAGWDPRPSELLFVAPADQGRGKTPTRARGPSGLWTGRWEAFPRSAERRDTRCHRPSVSELELSCIGLGLAGRVHRQHRLGSIRGLSRCDWSTPGHDGTDQARPRRVARCALL